MLGRRGNKPLGAVAILLIIGIIAEVGIVIYVAAMGFAKQADGPLRGSGSLPPQAALGAGAQPSTATTQR